VTDEILLHGPQSSARLGLPVDFAARAASFTECYLGKAGEVLPNSFGAP
jgi:hypothetical protein